MYEPVIGLEVHVQLKTRTKAFCGCSTEFGKEANTQVCPVCLGFPGVLPMFNKSVLEYGLKTGLALNCQIQKFTKFDRKHYFYPDLPKNYQISQYDLPLAKNGFLDIEPQDIDQGGEAQFENGLRRIGITRVHMEEDAGKLIHKESVSLVDYNRTGMPLLEIVSEPCIFSALEAYAYLKELRSCLIYLDISDCDMEKGSLRCDANISLRKTGEKKLGIKTEIKNLNSFKAVRDALGFEIERQNALLKEGKKIVQETRLWDDNKQCTVSMRGKEEAKDYRYFPEPDLAPIVLDDTQMNRAKEKIPELPAQKRSRFSAQYGLSSSEILTLTETPGSAQFAESCFKAYKDNDKKLVINWLIGPVTSAANNLNMEIWQLKLSCEHLAGLVEMVAAQKISNLAAKSVLEEMIKTGNPPEEIMKKKNLGQISDTASLTGEVEEVIKENAKSVADYRAGKSNSLMFLVGQVMKKTGGKANPKVVQELLKGRLNDA